MKEEKKSNNTKQTKNVKSTMGTGSTTKKKTSVSTKKPSVKKPTTTKSATKKTTDMKKKEEVVKKVNPPKEIIVEEKVEEKKVLEKEEYKPINSISYMTVIASLLGVVLIVIVLAKMFGVNQNIDYTESYMVKNNIVHQINCSDIPNAITGSQSFIYIPDLGSEEEYKLEKKLSNILREKNLQQDFYIYNDSLDNCGPLSNPESVAGSNLKLEKGIEKTPVILYYRDGVLTEVVEREDEAMLNDGDFAKLLDMYEIK